MIGAYGPSSGVIDMSLFKKMSDYEKDLRSKAESGDIDAMIQLFLDYAHGSNGIKANEQIAIRWLNMALEKGDARAMGYKGLLLYKQKKYPKALELLEDAYEAGFKEVAFTLYMYYSEKPTLDEAKASYWIEKSAEDTYSPGSQIKTGNRYLLGKGVEKDLSKGKQWIDKAFINAKAESNDKAECYGSYGYIHQENGETQKAKECYQEAIKLGRFEYSFLLGGLFEKEGNMEKALEYYQYGADHDVPACKDRLKAMKKRR